MRIMVTGATGFIGRHVVASLLGSGHRIICVARDKQKSLSLSWRRDVEFIYSDLHQDPLDWQVVGVPDALIHLAWPGLPNYNELFHISGNLVSDISFLNSAINAGVPHITVAGTCLEYGMQYGPLAENLTTNPVTSYGIAKDTLRKALEVLSRQRSFNFQWARLFYTYGQGQGKNSLLAQLERAIDASQPVFKMSAGDQLRDYLPVEEVAACFGYLAEHPEINGVINICSGKPVSVIDLVKRYVRHRDSNIEVITGYYPYNDYEPLSFWGLPEKLIRSGYRHTKTGSGIHFENATG